MGFSQMMELLQVKNKEKIVLCNAGNFYIAIGKDAVLLNELLGLKLACLKPEMCKEVLMEYKGKKKNEIKEERKNCYICSNDIKKYKKVDKYIMALAKLYEREEDMLQIIMKLPRVEKFSIGTEYKQSMYQMLKDIVIINKIEKSEILLYLNKIDANLNTQRIYLRIMKKNRWIDEHNETNIINT